MPRASAPQQDNGIFLDDNYAPWPDQWAFLASVRKMDRAQIEGIVQVAERRGRVLGVRLPPQDDGEDAPWAALPSRRPKEAAIVGAHKALELILGNQIYIAKDGLPPALRNRLPTRSLGSPRKAPPRPWQRRRRCRPQSSSR